LFCLSHVEDQLDGDTALFSSLSSWYRARESNQDDRRAEYEYNFQERQHQRAQVLNQFACCAVELLLDAGVAGVMIKDTVRCLCGA
jgi:hypothetical protein